MPEQIGTWLVLANEKESVYKAETLQEAFKNIQSASIFNYLFTVYKAPETEKNSYAIFHLKAAKMATQYKQVFATLAKEYKCRIAAGSLLLPDAEVDTSNSIQLKQYTHLYNTYFLFDSTGTIIQPVAKTRIDTKRPDPMNSSIANQFVTTKNGTISILAAEKYNTNPAKTDSLFNNIQHGLFLEFNGNLFNQQYNGKIQMIKQDSAISLPASTGKGRIVCLWLK